MHYLPEAIIADPESGVMKDIFIQNNNIFVGYFDDTDGLECYISATKEK